MKEIIKYNIKKLKKITSMEDFYKKVKILKRIESKEITDVNQIYMCKENCEKLCDYIKLNVKKNKNLSNANSYNDKYLNNIAAMDWLMFSPNMDEFIPDDEIWIFTED